MRLMAWKLHLRRINERLGTSVPHGESKSQVGLPADRQGKEELQMFKRINELKAKKGHSEQGFTLIELLIVVAIIGILAAIAIPQFANYRLRAFNSSSTSDVRNLRTAEEAVFADFQVYGMTGGAAALLPGAGGFGAGTVSTGPMGPATAAVTGAMLTTTGAGAAVGVGIGVGNLVSIISSTDAAGASFAAASFHQNGDTAYGADSDSTALFWARDATWRGTVTASGAADLGMAGYAGTPPPVAGADDFTGVGAGGVPIANWTPQ